MMDKRFFDPRRPLGAPTAEDKAEMLIPYAAELPLAPQLFATHDRIVANLHGAHLHNVVGYTHQIKCYCSLPLLGGWSCF